MWICQAKLITPSVVSERLKVNGSVARVAIRHLEEHFTHCPYSSWLRTATYGQRIGSRRMFVWSVRVSALGAARRRA